MEQRVNEQAAILGAAKRYVKPGGRLAYVTCSLFAEENGDQIARFINDDPSFAPVDHIAQREMFSPALDRESARTSGTGITLTPARTGTDGFFISVLQAAA